MKLILVAGIVLAMVLVTECGYIVKGYQIKTTTKCLKEGLKSVHNLFISAQPDGSVQVNRQNLGGWEKIRIVQDSDKKHVSMKSAHNTFLSAQPNGKLEWNRSKIGSWEKFLIIRVDETHIGFKSVHNKYICATDHGGLVADRTKLKSWETFWVTGNCLTPRIYDCSTDKPVDNAKWVMKEFRYDLTNAEIVSLTPQVIATQSILNEGSGSDQYTFFKASETVKNTVKFTSTKGVKIKAGTEFTAGVPNVASGKVSLSIEASVSQSESKETSVAKTMSAEYRCNAPAFTSVKCTALLFKTKVDVPYKITWVNRYNDKCLEVTKGICRQISGTEMLMRITDVTGQGMLKE